MYTETPKKYLSIPLRVLIMDHLPEVAERMKESTAEGRATFTEMATSTQEDWNKILAAYGPFLNDLPRRIIEGLKALEGDFGGFPVDRLTHCLQTATRAERDGRDEEYIVCALVHDIGDTLAPLNHGELAAAMLKPYVSDENYWVVKHHTTFQGKYYFDKTGGDPDSREKYRSSPHFDACAEFCEKYDQNSFDPDYDTLPLEHFIPALKSVFSRPPRAS